MADSLGTLHVKLDADTATFKSKLVDAKEGIAGFASGAGSMLSAFAGGIVGGILVGAVGNAVGSIKGFITSGAEAADQMGKFAQKAGMPVEEMSRLAHAADLSGVSAKSLTHDMGFMAKAMAEAAAGSGHGAKAFDLLGIQVADATGRLRPTSAVLYELADRFKAMPDGAAKSALALQIFGKHGQEMIPLLNAGSEGLRAMGIEADQLGLTVTQGAAKSAEEFNDNLTRLNGVGRGFALNLAGQLAPALASVTQWLLDSAKSSGVMNGAATALAVTIKTLIAGGMVVGAVFEAVGKSIGSVGAALVLAAQGNFKEAYQALQLGGGDVVSTVSSTYDRIKEMFASGSAKVAAEAEPTAEATAAPVFASHKRIKDAADKAVKEAESARDRLNRVLSGLAVKEASAADNTEIARVQVRLSDGGDLAADLAKLKPAEAAEYREKILAAATAVDEMKESAARAKANQDALNEMMREGAQVTAAARTPLERHNDELDRLRRLLERGAISPETYLRAVKAQNEEFAKAKVQISAMAEAWRSFGAGFQDVLEQQMVDGFRKGVRGMLDAFGDMIRRMLAQAAAARISQALLGGFAVLGKAAMGAFSPYSGGGETADVGGFMDLEAAGYRASGGPVTSGAPYVIGERGPELFIPSVSGQVVSNEDLGPAGGVRSPQVVKLQLDERSGRQTVREWFEQLMLEEAASR